MKKLSLKQKRFFDFVLILLLLIIAGVYYLLFNAGAQTGAYAVVRVNGEEVARYSLEQSAVYELNGGTNVLVIEDGICWLCEADCPDKLCVKQGRIYMTGQCITCLPNKLTVTVYSAGDGPDIFA